MKLISVKKASPPHKYVATFDDGKQVKFGAAGYSDYTIHKDKERRERYLARHKANETWNDPQTPGSLAKHLLWGESTSFQTNLDLFKKKFNL
jgi:hypothetical protein